MKIPFDIKYKPQIESGEYKVVTRDGHSARIICWDRFVTRPYDNCNIVALVTETKYESTYYYYQDGHLWNKANGEGDSSLDLFIITPEPKLTEFEEMLYSILDAYNGVEIDVRAAVDVNAKTLLELAKKEICKGCTVGLEQYWKGREDARKEYEKPITYHYPMYEPPCVLGGICADHIRDCINCSRTTGDINTSTTSGTCKKED